MPFVITATGPTGAVSVERDTATETLEKMLDLEAAGYQGIEVKDNGGRKLSRAEIEALSSIKEDD